MDEAYACADLVVSRAGSGTVFELMALKKPALFIPLSLQTRGDQQENAEYFAKKRLCKVLAQDKLDLLASKIDETFQDETLKRNLQTCDFTPANAFILSQIKNQLTLKK